MLYISLSSIVVATLTLLGEEVIAHPGHDLTQEIAERNAFYQNSKQDPSHCSEKLRKRGVHEKQIKRRQAFIGEERMKRGLSPECALVKRADVISTSHLSSLDVTPDTTGVEGIIFGNSSCLLSPEGEEGHIGEYIRSNISEGQDGVEIIVDMQFIDIDTCEPIENLTSDIWHCNSTGVYSGVIATGNGNNNNLKNINTTFLRGLQTTDSDGVVQYTSIFPGHYSGRATHVHVESHLNGTILPNGTYTGGSIAHIGQFFFDQDLITEVNTLSPYLLNTIVITENVDDRVVKAEITNNADPFLNYVLLGNAVSDGLFMWITLGVNASASYTASPASLLTSSGGEAVSGAVTGTVSGVSGNSTMGGGGANGTLPSGSMVLENATVNVSATASPSSATFTSGANRRFQILFSF